MDIRLQSWDLACKLPGIVKEESVVGTETQNDEKDQDVKEGEEGDLENLFVDDEGHGHTHCYVYHRHCAQEKRPEMESYI